MKRIILGVKFNTETKEELLDLYKTDIEAKNKVITMPSNLDTLRMSYKSRRVRKYFNSATYSTIDGVPLLWIAKWLKIKDCNNKISGSDLGIDVLEMMNKNNYSLFVFGGKEGITEKAVENIQAKYPNIRITGYLSPKFGYESNKELCKQYVNAINESKPDVVFLCTGAPKTEKFYYDNKNELIESCYFCLGATIDFIAGAIKRAPKWMSKIGLEWLYRLGKDFQRLFKRYWLDGWFLIRVWFAIRFRKGKIKKITNSAKENEPKKGQ